MKNPLRKRYVLILLPILIVVVSVVMFISFRFRPKAQPKLECHIEEVQTMTIQEAANLLKTPLVEAIWLPSNINEIPRIEVEPSYVTSSPELSKCNADIIYFEADNQLQHEVLRISLYNLNTIVPTKIPPRCSWHFSPSGPIGTDCSKDVDSNETTLQINIRTSPLIAPEDTIRILEAIRVVEPSE